MVGCPMETERTEREDIHVFLEAVYSKYGYDFRDYAPTSIRRRVLAALAKSGLADLPDLQRKGLE